MKIKIGITILLLIVIIANSSFADGPYNYAQLWRSWSTVAQEAYISGVIDGISKAFFITMTTVAPEKFVKTPEPPEVIKARDKLFVRFTRDQIRDVITYIYKDPANSFISTLDMFLLARDKIEGKDIDQAIMKDRKNAIDTYQLNEEMHRRK
jgi:hypothetical protein